MYCFRFFSCFSNWYFKWQIFSISWNQTRGRDPLSPYLFILSAELLAKEIYARAMSSDKLLEVKLGRSGIKISFLTFANDTILFAKATNKSCEIIKSVLDKYYAMFGAAC